MDYSDVVNDELEALQGIYCGPGEFEFLASSDSEKLVVIKVQTMLGTSFQLTVNMKCDYPLSVPQLALQVPCLSRLELDSLESQLRIEAGQLKGDPMILSLVSWLTEQVTNLGAKMSNSSNEDNAAKEVTHTVVVNLDHIRSHHMYTKLLRQWCWELNLQGLLLWHNNNIWLLMSGAEGNIKEYLKRHRTSNVDVDSNGRVCKERMMIDVGHVKDHEISGIPKGQLKVSEWKNADQNPEWEEFLSTHCLVDIFKKLMQPFENLR